MPSAVSRPNDKEGGAKSKKELKKMAKQTEEMSEKKKRIREEEEEAEDSDSETEEERKARKAARKAAKKAKREAEAAAAANIEADEGDEEEAKKARKAEKKTGKGNKRKAGDDDETEAATRKASPEDAEEEKFRQSLHISLEGGGKGAIPPCVRTLEDAPFDAATIKSMQSAGFSKPSAIQSICWPLALRGSDVVAVAKTGSGKTLGFLLPAFKRIAEKKKKGAEKDAIHALVLAPTRELAMQIEVECSKFTGSKITSCCLYGGVPVSQHKNDLRNKKPEVVIATPGRLVDLLGQGSLSLSHCGYVVMDEADRMLDMGFEPQITKVFAALPDVQPEGSDNSEGGRQTLLFTATWPKAVRKMAAKFLSTDMVQIMVGENKEGELEANKAIKQRFIESTDDEKDAKLWKLLLELGEKARMVMFANTKRRVDYLANALWDEGVSTCSIHGDKQQSDRDKAVQDFVAGKTQLLVATDVAARGLDIKGVTHVINFDMARDVESYIHRIGRTGRAGELGESITFWNPDYDKECTPALIKIAREANQEVPEWLAKYGSVKANKAWKVEDAKLVF